MDFVEKFLDQGYKFHCEAKLDLAAVSYAHVLKIQPNHFDALHLLGVIKYQTGSFREAEDCFLAAINLEENSAILYSNYGLVLEKLYRFEEAIFCFDF